MTKLSGYSAKAVSLPTRPHFVRYSVLTLHIWGFSMAVWLALMLYI